MTVNLTAYMCNEKFPGIEVVRPDLSGISVEDDEVTVKLVPSVAPLGCILSATDQVKVDMEPTVIGYGRSLYYCRETGEFLSISYPTPIGQDYPEFTVKNASHCHWFATQTLGSGPPRCTDGYGCLFSETVANSGGEDIPDDKADVFPNLGAENIHQMTNNFITPGMLVSVRHYFYNGTETISDVPESEYYTSEPFTGGIVTSINGTYGDIDITYNVSVEGETIECRPSDWVEWEIDDWVIVLKEQEVIVPMRIGLDGA